MDKEKARKLEEYLSYNYPVSFVFEDGNYYVWYEDLPGCQADGKTLDEAIRNLEEVKRTWLEVAIERGMNIPKPGELSSVSGKILLRLPVDLHKSVVMLARKNKTSVNQYLIHLISLGLGLAAVSSEQRHEFSFKNTFEIEFDDEELEESEVEKIIMAA